MLIDLLIIIILSFIPAAFNYFLDFCLGHPMSEDKVSIKAIFFAYSLALAKKRLKKERLYTRVTQVYSQQLNSEDKTEVHTTRKQMKLAIMTMGRDYFTYEQALGMCPFCTNFWVAEISAVIFFFLIHLTYIHSIFFFILIPIFSHAILRKILN